MRRPLNAHEITALQIAVSRAIAQVCGGFAECVQWYTREPDFCIAYIAGTAHGLLWFRGIQLDVLDPRLDAEARRQLMETPCS